jgi:two-component sensor histidine kinase
MDDVIFIGTTTGLRAYKKESWEIYDKFNTLKDFTSNHYISHITDDEKYIFFSSINFGLVIYNKETNAIRRIDKTKGLLTNAICATLRDRSNRYWISTFNGLYVLDQELNLVKAYFEEDGINHNEFNRFSYLDSGDKLYFGGINGYLQIDLDEIAALKVETFSSYLSSISYYDVDTDTEHINIINGNPEMIVLNPSQSNLKVSVALPMDRNRGNLIRVNLNNGLNTNWTYLNERTLYNIGNLQKGDYELVIQEKGPGLSWDIASTTIIPIIKSDYFYNSPIFIRLILLVIMSSVLYYLYKRRKQKIELLEMRQRIAADLHDEIGSVLTGIASKAEILSNKKLYKESNDMDYFIKDSKKALEIMRDTIWSVNPAHDTLRSLTDRMKDFAFNMLSHKDIPIDYSIKIENESCRISPAFRKDIYMIFKEAITNILKHSNPSKVIIKISSRNNYYDLYISNDGVKKESGDGSKLGLSSMDQRAKELGGQLNIKNGKSFIIQLTCPI